MGCAPAKPEGAASDELGRIAFTGQGCCGDKAPFTFAPPKGCEPGRAPTDPAWEKAFPGLEPILAEVHEIVKDAVATKGCCGGYHGALDACKEKLLEKGWLTKVNDQLATQGFISDMHCFWIYNGQSATQHLHLRIFKTDGATGKALAEGGGEFPSKEETPAEEAA